ncbi:hypothetical protein [Arcobacter sp.]|uniref:hypothetical protein n=1 Tax=Arcobacter sp. TaxID=1872629 RepID=UPI003C774F9B
MDTLKIKKFNKRKGWWKTKWKIITILSLFLSLWFSLTTSSGGNIDWRNDNMYETVYKIEFYVKKYQADKILE